MKFAKAWIACIQRIDGTTFPHGSPYLYTEPFANKSRLVKHAADIVAKSLPEQLRVVRIEENECPVERIIRY